MDDVERLFRHLVVVLAEQAPARLGAAIPVDDLYQRIIPYRTCKAVLRFDTNQDYETALFRLLAGEHGYVTVDPDDAREAFLREAGAVDPDPAAFHACAAATVMLTPTAVRAVLDEPGAFAPPLAAPEQAPTRAEAAEGAGGATAGRGTAAAGTADTAGEMKAAERAAAGQCPHCFEPLPAGRTAVFCPFCGRNVKAIECPQCGEVLEPGWKYCITCGQSVMHG